MGLFIVIGFQNCGKGFKISNGSANNNSVVATPTPVISPTPGVSPSPPPPSPTPSPGVTPSPPRPSPTPSPGVTPSPSPTPVWSITYPTADTIELTVGSGSLDLKTTLPAAYQVMNGTFSVDPTGAALPAGMVLAPNGMLQVGSAPAGTTVSGVKFIFTTTP